MANSIKLKRHFIKLVKPPAAIFFSSPPPYIGWQNRKGFLDVITLTYFLSRHTAGLCMLVTQDEHYDNT